MNDFCEAVLTVQVPASMGHVYKKAIEAENSPYRDHWNGNHVHVEIIEDNQGIGEDYLIITMVSHTLPNLQQTMKWYVDMGANLINYKEVNQNGND